MKKKIVKLKFNDWVSSKVIDRGNGDVECRLQIGINLSLGLDASRQENFIRHYLATDECPFCGSSLTIKNRWQFAGLTAVTQHYDVCNECGCWHHVERDSGLGTTSTFPLVKQFDHYGQTPSLLHLSREISANPEKIYDMDPRKFEKFVGSLLAEHHDCEVYHVGKSGDDGVDLVAIVSDKPKLIQVKRRGQPDAVEGIDVVKLLFASAFGQDANSGVVVTTARKFSQPAIKWSRNRRLLDTNFNIELHSINDLMHMIDAVAEANAEEPWTIHNSKERAQSKRDWKLHGFEGGLILIDQRSQPTAALLIDFDYIERYWFAEGFPALADSNPIIEDFAKLRKHILRSTEALCLPQNSYFESRWGINHDVMEDVADLIISNCKDDIERMFG